MKNIASSISALAVSILLPVVVMASRTNTEVEPDEGGCLRALTPPIENPTTAFLLLDAIATKEMEDLGLESSEDARLVSDIIAYATQYLGRPYRSGGKGPSSFDCSGFTSFVFANFDIKLSPSSREQYTQGESIANSEIRPGDLLFFSGRKGGKTVGHVAMAVEVNDDGSIRFIHAARHGGIRHDTYPDGGYYSARYLGARRVL